MMQVEYKQQGKVVGSTTYESRTECYLDMLFKSNIFGMQPTKVETL